jgi:nucleoside-diphosphate-sugar epimerase
MRLLVVGYNGFLGRAIGARAAAEGMEVFGLSRSNSHDRFATCLVGDRREPESVCHAIRSLNIDLVVDVIAMTSEDSRALLAAIDGQIEQYVLLSSGDVYRNYELLQRRTQGTPTAGSAAEDSPLRQTRYPYRGSEPRAPDAPDRYLDDYDKIPIEQIVRTLSTPWTILRLPMIYGPGDRQRRFRWAIEPMSRGEQRLVVPRGWARWLSTYGYIENMAAGIVATLGAPQAMAQTFNLGEAAPVDHLEWARRIGRCMDWQGDIEITDQPDNPFARRIAGLDLRVSFEPDSGLIRSLLDYREIVDIETGLERTIAAELALRAS